LFASFAHRAEYFGRNTPCRYDQAMTRLLQLPPQRPRKRWTKHEYNELVERGFFEGDRVYLYRGELIETAAMGTLHARGIVNVNACLYRTFSPELIRGQLPFDTPGESMPEPDVVVVTSEQMRRRPHPNAALLVIEVSDSSVELDQEMAFDYAAALVPDYWIVNMRGRVVEVYRDPVPDASAPEGHRYAWHEIFREGQSVSPLVKPEVSFAVSTLVTVE
jgi:Uma2 family endonuclease